MVNVATKCEQYILSLPQSVLIPSRHISAGDHFYLISQFIFSHLLKERTLQRKNYQQKKKNLEICQAKK